MEDLVKEINEITERYDRMHTATIHGSAEGVKHQQECDFERLVYLVKKMNYIPCCKSDSEQLCGENDYGKIVAVHRFENGKWVKYKRE